MNIKSRLNLGIGILVALILFIAIMGVGQIKMLSGDTRSILQDNYNSLEYVRQMLTHQDNVNSDSAARLIFAENLRRQQNNITEVGEQKLTESLTSHVNTLLHQPADTMLRSLIRQDLYEIMAINMSAIQQKSQAADRTADSAVLGIVCIGTLCFLIGFTLLINLPGHIADPVRELTTRIKQIADRQYHQRLDFRSSSEFGELAQAFNVMAAKLAEYEDSNLSRILVEKKRIEALINNMHDPIIGLDENQTILFANDEALTILHLDAAAVIGHNARDMALVHDLLRELMRDILFPSPKNNPAKAATISIFAHGKESYFEKEIIHVSITPTGESESRYVGDVVILKNITGYKELDVAKTHFMATVSHELKTPISSIILGLQLLQDKRVGDLSEEQTNLITSIQDDTGRLLKITGELLQLSQVETGNIQLSIHETAPADILHYAIDTIRLQAAQREIVVRESMAPDLPHIQADMDKTAWVLVNFLTNAIRYSPEKSEVWVEVYHRHNWVGFSVRDMGKGIEARYREKIFDRYFQIPGSNKTGTGLGLAISKEFIEAQSGRIGVESEPGQGSCFFMELPTA
ncbi:MAG: ATP-binding protein [Bacteroidia bacterium]|nr:ATP-binding protein [Bacteroidia bacterium]